MDTDRQIKMLEIIHHKAIQDKKLGISDIRCLEKIIYDLGGKLYSTEYLNNE